MITLKKYQSYFKKDDGSYSETAPPCINCTEEEFIKCLRRNVGCDNFNKIAEERGWQCGMEGFDF